MRLNEEDCSSNCPKNSFLDIGHAISYVTALPRLKTWTVTITIANPTDCLNLKLFNWDYFRTHDSVDAVWPVWQFTKMKIRTIAIFAKVGSIICQIQNKLSKKNRQRLLKFCQICSHFNDFTLFGYQYYLQTTFSFRTTPKIQQDLKLPRQSRKKPSRKPGCQNGPTYLKSLLLSYLVGFVKSM